MAERSDKHPQWVIDLFFPTGPVEHDLQVLSFLFCFFACFGRKISVGLIDETTLSRDSERFGGSLTAVVWIVGLCSLHVLATG